MSILSQSASIGKPSHACRLCGRKKGDVDDRKSAAKIQNCGDNRQSSTRQHMAKRKKKAASSRSSRKTSRTVKRRVPPKRAKGRTAAKSRATSKRRSAGKRRTSVKRPVAAKKRSSAKRPQPVRRAATKRPRSKTPEATSVQMRGGPTFGETQTGSPPPRGHDRNRRGTIDKPNTKSGFSAPLDAQTVGVMPWRQVKCPN
jgi:hypothetical protein